MAKLRFSIFFLIIFCLSALPLTAETFTDDSGRQLSFDTTPQRVVSLVPSATEIICSIGGDSSLVGITYHDTRIREVADRAIVGGYFTPQFDLVKAQKPDLVIMSPEQQKNPNAAGDYKIFVWDSTKQLSDSFAKIELLGKLLQQTDKAQDLIAKNKDELALIAEKAAQIPTEKRQRVMRFLGRDELYTPGDDAMQSELIRAAGGLTPTLGKQGAFVPVSLEEWQKFNPQVLYGCGEDRLLAQTLFSQPGWSEVEAVKNGRIYYFDCDLTCRAASHTGYFVGWLASTIYTDEFGKNFVRPNQITSEKPIKLDFSYVSEAKVVESRLADFLHRTLLINFKTPQNIISTFHGPRQKQKTVGNSYSPPQLWPVYHSLAQNGNDTATLLFKTLGLKKENTALLLTGANLNNLAVKTEEADGYKVTALVTAGAESNALRSSRDEGRYLEKPGTINIIILTNYQLSPRAQTRAIITATEAKTAALWDLDIRSSQSSIKNPATGTGTDDVLVVEGEGQILDGAGGHTKLGELIAKAVYSGVTEALFLQNGKIAQRSIFERLRERQLSVGSFLGQSDCECSLSRSQLQFEMEKLLLAPRYQYFLLAALNLSDAQVMGRLADSDFFTKWALDVAGEIAGQPVEKLLPLPGSPENLTPILEKAFQALFTGVNLRPVPQK